MVLLTMDQFSIPKGSNNFSDRKESSSYTSEKVEMLAMHIIVDQNAMIKSIQSVFEVSVHLML